MLPQVAICLLLALQMNSIENAHTACSLTRNRQICSGSTHDKAAGQHVESKSTQLLSQKETNTPTTHVHAAILHAYSHRQLQPMATRTCPFTSPTQKLLLDPQHYP
jgi:hypothetical protein